MVPGPRAVNPTPSGAHSLDEAIAFFRRLPGELRQAQAEAMELGAHEVLHEVRNMVGEYQLRDMGPFQPWEELADFTKQDRIAQGYTENDPGLRSGDMRDAYKMSIVGRHAQVGSNDMKAVWFEKGTRGAIHGGPQPPRMVLGVAAWRKRTKIYEITTGLISVAIAEGMRGGR